jgi:hypothetical protein
MIVAAEALADAFVRYRDMDAALGERLEAYSNAVREFIPSYADAVDQLVSRLSNSGAGLKAPWPGEPMPRFVLPDDKGRQTSLESLLENGPIAITFHRGHCALGAGSARLLWRKPSTTSPLPEVRSRQSCPSGKGSRWNSDQARSRHSRSLPTWTRATHCR